MNTFTNLKIDAASTELVAADLRGVSPEVLQGWAMAMQALQLAATDGLMPEIQEGVMASAVNILMDVAHGPEDLPEAFATSVNEAIYALDTYVH